ncbi:TetR/AcrR family transcriptional regulator [Amycolatopsis methanolica]|uniref:TetR family transcriptional regulator n=1 Tax=Amycolatopsis methanolica 239 TaxID=1068978 RepID=A0A076MNE0_AMYME|nr:TetR/AcrR family transcriptional regulator [Amycolatopsis methanolica]AIJ20390.1 TetR family transcriptional regulator [Amycolatopsis methanolica 239]
MARLTRAETQERNRAKVLAAAREEFAERGFRDAKVDVIAERAELTRGAVYSNFPGKRALYFAVLADLATRAEPSPHSRPGTDARSAVGSFARDWIVRDAGLARDLPSEVMADERVRLPYAQLMELGALLLALAVERLDPPESPPGAPPARYVRRARAVLTSLHGARQLTVAAPGFVEPFDVISTCEQLAELPFNDWWAPPQVSPQPRPADEPWAPGEAVDLVRGGPVRLPSDGVVAVLGLHRLAVVEEAVRAGADVTLVAVTGEPAELGPLARLVITEVAACLRQAFPEAAWPDLRVVCDERGELAAAAGVAAVSDATEVAVRVAGGRIVARADGFGACHAVSAGKLAPAAAANHDRSS